MAVVKQAKKIAHPCDGMTPAQRRDFELIATGERPRGGYRTLNSLRAKGLIEDGPPHVVGRDRRLGIISIPTWTVPLPIHMQWCRWCSEHAIYSDIENAKGLGRPDSSSPPGRK